MVILEPRWTESFMARCLHHAFSHDAPTCLYVEERLEFQTHVKSVSPFLPPLFDEDHARAYLGHFELPWFIDSLPELGIQDKFSNLTTFMTHTTSAYFFDDK